MTLETTKTLFALDADIVIALRNLSLHEEIANTGRWPVVVTDVVWEEVASAKAPGPDRGLMLLQSIAGHQTELLADTPETDTLSVLLARSGGAGAGESSIVAYAIHHPEIVPVLRDGGALRLAVEELRERRVLGFHGLLQELQGSSVLPEALARQLSDGYVRRNPGHHAPLWW